MYGKLRIRKDARAEEKRDSGKNKKTSGSLGKCRSSIRTCGRVAIKRRFFSNLSILQQGPTKAGFEQKTWHFPLGGALAQNGLVSHLKSSSIEHTSERRICSTTQFETFFLAATAASDAGSGSAASIIPDLLSRPRY